MKIKQKVKRIIQYIKQPVKIPIVSTIPDNCILQGKVALICGGTGGIGRSVVTKLLMSGCSVIVAGTNVEKLAICKKEYDKDYSGKIETIVVDLSKTNMFSEYIDKAVSIFGKIDILVLAAGVHTENVTPWAMTPDEFERVVKINLEGPYFMSLKVAKHMIEKKIHGSILFISSSRGSEPAWSPYGLSKWGINGLTKGLAQQLISYEINVNAIAPGVTATGLLGVQEGDSIYSGDNKLQRMAHPDEISEFARLLVSDSGKFVSGEIIHVSAGRGTFDIR
jgi:NAD(P)-dependent dehydrogenase (short-subunit alcohol dehydrogenase family)